MPKLDLEVKLIGTDGNIFALMGIVIREMKRNGFERHVDEFVKDVQSSSSYSEALCQIMNYVTVR